VARKAEDNPEQLDLFGAGEEGQDRERGNPAGRGASLDREHRDTPGVEPGAGADVFWRAKPSG